jgi:hypothetical protein
MSAASGSAAGAFGAIPAAAGRFFNIVAFFVSKIADLAFYAFGVVSLSLTSIALQNVQRAPSQIRLGLRPPV